MNKVPTHITFPVGDLTIAVRAAQAYLVLDQRSARSLANHTAGSGGHFIVYRGRLIPSLDISRIFGAACVEIDDRSRHLVLEHGGQLASLGLPCLRLASPDAQTKVSLQSDGFWGLQRLLIHEQRHTNHGVWNMLDVEMAVRIANQASERSQQSEPAGLPG